MTRAPIGKTAKETRKHWSVPDYVPGHAVLVTIERLREPLPIGHARFGFFEWEKARAE